MSLFVEPPLDEDLIAEMRAGNSAALASLFNRYYRLVFDVARRILRNRAEAEDILQDVFIEVYRKAGLYDGSKGSVRNWLLQYAYHRSFNRRKYLALRNFYNAAPAAALVDLELAEQRGGREDLTMQEWKETLQHGMEELTDKERAIISAVAFDGLTVREASERAHESYMNGRNHYYRGLKKLRRFLEKLNSRSPLEEKDVRS